MRPRDPAAELAEREDWLDHLPQEIDRAIVWLRDERTRLLAVEEELRRRVGELERALAQSRKPVSLVAGLRERWLRRSRSE